MRTMIYEMRTVSSCEGADQRMLGSIEMQDCIKHTHL